MLLFAQGDRFWSIKTVVDVITVLGLSFAVFSIRFSWRHARQDSGAGRTTEEEEPGLNRATLSIPFCLDQLRTTHETHRTGATKLLDKNGWQQRRYKNAGISREKCVRCGVSNATYHTIPTIIRRDAEAGSTRADRGEGRKAEARLDPSPLPQPHNIGPKMSPY